MNLHEIPAHRPFLDDLARGVLALHGGGGDPAALARVTLLLPTRRAARSLRESFLRAAGGGAMLLPRLRPLAGLSTEDAEELSLPALLDLPPAVEPARRQAVLTGLVQRLPTRFGGPATPEQAWRLARELATLLDEVALEGLDPAGLPGLVPGELARHWEVTHTFLAGALGDWRAWLAEQGLTDVGERRVAALRAQAASWRESPPEEPVIAAGIGVGGTIPAAVELLSVLARLPSGAVVLHGAGEEVPEELWPVLSESPTHPQHGAARLLAGLGARAADLRPWPATNPGAETAAPRERAALLARALRPEQGIACWRERDAARWSAALPGLDLLTAPDEAAEAAAVALLLREALETPGARAALITPDRDLARRVSAELERHGIVADDSAGLPLGATPAGAFLRLLPRVLEEGFAPVPLLALLKHPLAAGGMARAEWLGAARLLEHRALRGPRPAPGLAGLRAAAGTIRGEAGRGRALALLDALEAALGPFRDLGGPPRPPADLLAGQLAAAEALAATDERPGALRLYAGEEGEPLAAHLSALGEAVAELPPLDPADWPALFDALMEGPVAPGVRPMRGRKGGSHPRVQILGLLEARLQSFDRVVLGALEESVWPLATDPGAWLSRPMRRDFGLPAPEARIGRVCADFALSALSSPRATLSRARRRGGSPTVPARWITRLETFLQGQGLPGLPASPAAAWAARLDAPEAVRPRPRPAPCPPAALRPRELRITEVALLRDDPYAWYARRVLSLRPLEALDAEPGAADYGNLVHGMVADWLRRVGGDPHRPGAEAAFAGAVEAALEAAGPRPGLAAAWRPRLARVAAFVLETERGREGVAERRAELSGEAVLPCGVALKGRADRVDLLADGTLAILDLKTGAPPRDEQMRDGWAPQLPLEAAIAARGGFRGVPPGPVSELAHWRVSGGEGEAGNAVHRFRPKGEETILAVAEAALAGADGLARAFLLGERPFLARPHPGRGTGRRDRPGDYDHLARRPEWDAAEEEA